jgi:hypothetical protein
MLNVRNSTRIGTGAAIIIIIIGLVFLGFLLVGTGIVGRNFAPATSLTTTTTQATTISNQFSASMDGTLQSIASLENGSAVCISVNGLPDPSCTPGAINSNVTQNNIDSTICVSGWTSTVRPPESYTEPLKYASIKDYGYNDTYVGDYEEDHLIPLELGGSPTSVYNLWAEPHYGNYTSYDKDALENYLNHEVCDGYMSLAQAQHDIASNWVQYWIEYTNGQNSTNGD